MFIAVNPFNNINSIHSFHKGSRLIDSSSYLHILDTEDLIVEDILVGDLIPLLKQRKIFIENVYIYNNMSVTCDYRTPLSFMKSKDGFLFKNNYDKIRVLLNDKTCIEVKLKTNGIIDYITETKQGRLFVDRSCDIESVAINYAYKYNNLLVVRCVLERNDYMYPFTIVLDENGNLIGVFDNNKSHFIQFLYNIDNVTASKFLVLLPSLKY